METVSVNELARVQTGSFQERFCAKFSCRAEDFAEQVFWRCLHSHAALPARLLWARSPAFFKRDFELIKVVQEAASYGEMRREVELFRQYSPPEGLLQDTFRLRISGRRLLNLGGKLFA